MAKAAAPPATCSGDGSENVPLTSRPVAVEDGSATLSVASPAVETVVAVVAAVYSRATPGVKAPKVAGAPSVSASVAGTVPPTPPCVQSETSTVWPLSIVIDFVSATVPSGSVQVSVQDSCRKPFGPGTMPSARYGGFGRTDGLTFHENLPETGTVIEDSRCVGTACGGVVEAGADHGPGQAVTTAPPRRGSPPPLKARVSWWRSTAWQPPKNRLRSRNQATLRPAASSPAASIPGSA